VERQREGEEIGQAVRISNAGLAVRIGGAGVLARPATRRDSSLAAND